ncbi:hypothetical protein HY78_19410 [Rhizorhabdus wittichii DC-6]|nr:hypothetical protein HY78_19410 [Rhizorhabdus wittichii DC-6]
MADSLQILLDKRALDEMVYKCMHAMDTHQWTLYRANIVEDATFDFTDHGVATDDAAEPMRGADNYLEILASVITGFDSTQHAVSNMYHEVEGDRARTKCYIQAEHFLNNDRGDRRVACGGRYLIDAIRTPDGWKIKHLKFQTFWFTGNTTLYELAGRASAAKRVAA